MHTLRSFNFPRVPRSRDGFVLADDWRFRSYLGKRESFLYFSGCHTPTNRIVWLALPVDQDEPMSPEDLRSRFAEEWPTVEPLSLVVSRDGMFVAFAPLDDWGRSYQRG